MSPAEEDIGELPFSYNQTKLVLLVRDPEWAYGYWDFSAETWNWLEDFRRKDLGIRPRLRIHNLERGSFAEIDVNLEAKNWYIHLGSSNTTFEAELGLLDSQGKFHRIALSNRIRTPRSGPSDVIDPHWKPEDFEKIYRWSGGGEQASASGMFSRIKPKK